ncbi:hypothetical protein JEQ12_006428 [Ovis aries]|uniref:Uncharacterized protein n=1 Tax=Ovis aries TaxID=9940 RepID=A0A835ZU48_SHEEP|nr:hypothetical protein JEQ12_006428 [Ovis aries]
MKEFHCSVNASDKTLQTLQSKSWLNRIDKQLIRWRHQAAEAGKAIKGLQLLRAKRFQVNVAGDFAFCHLEDAGHTVVADRTSGARSTQLRICRRVPTAPLCSEGKEKPGSYGDTENGHESY